MLRDEVLLTIRIFLGCGQWKGRMGSDDHLRAAFIRSRDRSCIVRRSTTKMNTVGTFYLRGSHILAVYLQRGMSRRRLKDTLGAVPDSVTVTKYFETCHVCIISAFTQMPVA